MKKFFKYFEHLVAQQKYPGYNQMEHNGEGRRGDLLRIEGIKLRPGEEERKLYQEAAAALRIGTEAIESLRVVRKSIDARDGVFLVYSVQVAVKNEGRVFSRIRDRRVSKVQRERYRPPQMVPPPALPPVVVGAGPAGLFCALLLAQAGARPILLERGASVEQRQRDVERFWQTGRLLPSSNVQFGEGGAGTFSDGKLNTGTRDLCHRYILGKLVELGAPEAILTDAKPHVGTDRLHVVLKNLRAELLRLGAEIRFGHCLTEIETREGAAAAAVVEGPEGTYRLPAAQIVLALGHSARDTVEMLYSMGLAMEPKPFAVGVRIEHLQREMDAVQYGEYAGHPALPPTSYKLSCHLGSGRSVFSFCVCPGGQVVAAASEEGRCVTNGMSCYARDGENINGGLLVNVTPADFGNGHPLGGIAFQRQLEEAAFRLGGGDFHAPAQLVGDFLAGRASTAAGRVKPTYRPGVRFTDLRRCLPPFVAESIVEALPLLDRRIHGFAQRDAVLTAVESRSSAPVRILRDEKYEASVKGVYPCGEGAGYAGGIMSAAADGIHVAEQILEELR